MSIVTPAAAPSEESDGSTETAVRQIAANLPREFRLPLAHIINRTVPTTEDPSVGGQHGDRFDIGPSVVSLKYVTNRIEWPVRTASATPLLWFSADWGGFSCPYLFVALEGGVRPFSLGRVLVNRIGPAHEGTETVNLPAGVTRIQLRELERETTHLQAATLIVWRGHSRMTFGAQGLDRGEHDLLPGQSFDLDFGYTAQPGDEAPRLQVTGFYTRTPI